MDKKALALTCIIALLVTAVAELSAMQLVSANFFPETAPAGIQIDADGTIKGTDLIEHSGNIYTLNGNIKDTIVILCDGIVLDGAGYTLEGSGGGVGVFLQARNNVSIKNMRIRNFDYGIKLPWLYYGSPNSVSGKTISGNTLTNNTYGIYIDDYSSGNKISSNVLSGNTYGICLKTCSDNTLRDNRMDNNDFNFYVSGGTLSTSANDVDQSNTVNGAPIIYWVNEQGKAVPQNAGYVALVNCKNMSVENLNLSHNGQSLLLAGVTNSKITDNKITENRHGIWLIESENNQVENNIVTGNVYEGFYLSSSNNNQITTNTLADNGLEGTPAAQETGLTGRSALRLLRSSNNDISSNKIMGNGEGVNLQDSNGNIISTNTFENTYGSTVNLFMSENNTITKNTLKGSNECAIKIWSSDRNTVSCNRISNNNLGILLDHAAENTIIQNDITNNKGFGMQLKSPSALLGGSENNIIHQNNFINNQPDGLDVSIPNIMGEHQRGGDPFSMEWVPGLGNIWDDGREGNYWSDYLTRYPDASEVANTGVGNTAYTINENNADRHPLMSPVEISVGSSSQESTITPSSETQTQLEPLIPLQFFVAIFIIISILIGVGLMVYSKKRKREAAIAG
jgi:parallel beta-helix repeat protein